MADEKITDLTALAVAPASGDLLEIVDVSDTSTAPAGAGGSNKKITSANLLSIGSVTQAWDADLDAFAALTSGANLMPYYTGSNTMGTADFLNWGTFAPTWTGLGPGNPSGAGTAIYHYAQIGKTVIVRLSLVLGIGGTVGTNPSVSTPTTLDQTGSALAQLGWARLLSGGTVYAGQVSWNNSTSVGFRALNASATYSVLTTPNATIPGTWVAGDKIDAQFVYRAA